MSWNSLSSPELWQGLYFYEAFKWIFKNLIEMEQELLKAKGIFVAPAHLSLPSTQLFILSNWKEWGKWSMTFHHLGSGNA